jgi:hypothetical protein
VTSTRMMTEDLREAFRTLLLPVDPAREQDVLDAAKAAMSAAGIEPPDQPGFIRLELKRLKAGAGLHNDLAALVESALRAGDPELGGTLAAKYYELHEAVLQERHLMSFEEASAFLSHARLIVQLAINESMSAAQISNVLSARDHRVDFSWQSVQDVLARLGFRKTLDTSEVRALFERDAELEEAHFADADFAEAASIVGRAGTTFGFPNDLERLLLHLFPPPPSEGTRHGPYLQILHFQCVIAEFFDHPLTVLYEFSPRGAVANWLFDRYPGDLSGAGNPFLNNAKSVDRLDEAWARAKDRQGLLRPASALQQVVAGLEVMGFAARQQLAGWLRRWLLRVIRLTRPLASKVPDHPTSAAIAALLDSVAQAETRTSGIIEQRVVDAIAVTRHLEDHGWRSHGVGDSVNASNVSRRKLGDCEFQNAAERKVVAYEAHAGTLSRIYLDAHVQTLARVMPLRAGEWIRIADLDQWQLEIVFVAHSFTCLPTNVEIEGLEVVVDFVEFPSLIQRAPAPSSMKEVFAAYVNHKLNERRTPQRVRDTYLHLTSGKHV